MKRGYNVLIALLLFFIFPVHSLPAQAISKQDTVLLKRLTRSISLLEFHAELVQYVQKQYDLYGEMRLPQERFLVSLMRLVNREMHRRIPNIKKARRKYFADLKQMLQEIEQLHGRLQRANIQDLDRFIIELAARIQLTLERGEIDYRKKKVFEDALQMLYVAEEMIQLDRAQSGQTLRQKVQESRQKLLSTFGEPVQESASTTTSSGEPTRRYTIYDLFKEWRKYDIIDYQARLAEVKVVRKNLLEKSGLNEILRMFNDELEYAYLNFNYEDYDLAERLLADILETYPAWGVRNLDDVWFYRAESNFALLRFDEAKQQYEQLLQTYPNTVYLPDALSRLVQISYSTDNFDATIDYARQYRNVASSSRDDYYDVAFLQAMAYQQLGDYNQAVNILQEIPESNPYYAYARYFIANIFASNKLYDDAVALYVALSSNPKTPKEIIALSYYKLGIMEYERKNYDIAIQYLMNIPPDYPRYDKVLNALAWAHYELEMSKLPDNVPDFTLARQYAKQLLDEYYASPYRMEAQSLIAYLDQLEGKPLSAIEEYRQVYAAKQKEKSFYAYLEEKHRLEELHDEARRLQERALQMNKPEVFARAKQIGDQLESELQSLELAENSAVGASVYRELGELLKTMTVLDSLKRNAIEQGNKAAIKKIDSIMVRLVNVLEMFPAEMVASAKQVNWFDEYPVSRYVADEKFRYNKNVKTRQEILADYDDLLGRISRLEDAIQIARNNRDYSALINLEIELQQLDELRKKYDRLLATTYFIDASPNPYPEFNKWGDFGAFGIINVHFEQQRTIQDKITYIANLMNRVNAEIENRKKTIEDKIKKIEAEIRFMTMRARREERARLKAERERQFRETYFDTSPGEEDENQ